MTNFDERSSTPSDASVGHQLIPTTLNVAKSFFMGYFYEGHTPQRENESALILCLASETRTISEFYGRHTLGDMKRERAPSYVLHRMHVAGTVRKLVCTKWIEAQISYTVNDLINAWGVY